MITFNEKILVITGGAGGIGKATAELFHENGGHVVLCDISKEGLSEIRDEFVGQPRIHTFLHDVTEGKSSEDLVTFCKSFSNHIDYVVNCAGIYVDQDFATMSFAQWSTTMKVNLDGVFLTTRALLPLIATGGSIVNLTSVAAHRGSKLHSHYATAKAGLLGLTKTLAAELAPNIRVNAVSPGAIRTEMTRGLLGHNLEKIVSDTYLHRVGDPKEVANVIAFLCSDLASFVTGEVIHVNGGWYISG